MRCAWSGGFIAGLQELQIIPSVIIATSGNVGNAVCFASGQTGIIKKVWSDYLTGTRFINFFRINKIVDIDYLFDDVLTLQEPVDFEAVKKSKVNVVIVSYNTTKKKTDYFTSKELTMGILKSSASIPLLYGKKILINSDLYSDHPSSPYQLIKNVKQQIPVKKIIVDMEESNILFNLMCSIFIKGLYRKVASYDSSVMIVSPKKLNVNLLTRKKSKINSAFDQGYNYALTHKDELLLYINS